jgi:gluconolactonase
MRASPFSFVSFLGLVLAACGSSQNPTPPAGAGAAGGNGGSSGAGGSSGKAGAGSVGSCPPGAPARPTLGGSLSRVPGVPPADAFNSNNENFGNVEGPVWVGDALYVSEMNDDSYDSQNPRVNRSRILKLAAGDQVSVFVADSGSNGLAVDRTGSLVAAVHKDGTLTRFALPGGQATPLVTTFMGARFDSPNDLAIRSDGTIYFSDPSYQAPDSLPQAATRVYRVPNGSTNAEPIPSAASPDTFNNPNGVTLSIGEDFLYVAASTGRRYPVMPDGTLGAGESFPASSGGDGMTVDCAGNLYVARQRNVVVYTPAGQMIGSIPVPEVQSATNVAFGGTDQKTLFVTGLGDRKGLFRLTLDIPGRPY